MPRTLTLFTGQWADLPLERLAPMARSMGYDGLELACWGDHFDVLQAADSRSYCERQWQILGDHGLTCEAISNHLVGQAVCDLIDERHQSILPAEVWGDGEPEGVRRRAAERMQCTATAARAFFAVKPYALGTDHRVVVNGFTGSSIWHMAYAFPSTTQAMWQRGFDDFAQRWMPILHTFDGADVDFALEVHPTEIAFDTATAQRALAAVSSHRRFGFNFDPSHFAYQGVDPVGFIRRLGARIFHTHIKDVWWNRGDGTVGTFGGNTCFGDPRRTWDFRSPGRGDIRFEDIIVALNDVGYRGPLSVEWEDARMDREFGATEAAAFVRRLDFRHNGADLDSAFNRARRTADPSANPRTRA
jgi:sugar phosphate isomerase/epimerase